MDTVVTKNGDNSVRKAKVAWLETFLLSETGATILNLHAQHQTNPSACVGDQALRSHNSEGSTAQGDGKLE